MKIIHTVGSVGKKAYGLGSISMGLAKAQLDFGEDVYVMCSDQENDVKWASENYNFPYERIFAFPSSLPFHVSSQALKFASNQRVDIVHQHSLWTFHSFFSPILQRKGAKTCIAAHGTLSDFALNKSKAKKDIALKLYERRHLRKTDILHATSEFEIEDFRRMGLTNPIAYIDNGIGEKVLGINGDADRFNEKYKLPNKKKLLYLSRITPKKGLSMLLPAIAALQDAFDDWVLIIVGNDEFGYQSQVEDMIKALHLEEKVFIIEPQFGKEKFDVFEASDFFILPSYSEGSPMVVLDALAYGLPVITTKSSSWKDLERHKCGYWVEINEDAIKESLEKMISLSDADLKVFSVNSKKMIESKYLWDKISGKTVDLYQWLLNTAEKPNFIY